MWSMESSLEYSVPESQAFLIMPCIYAHRNGAFYELFGENANWMHEKFEMPLLRGTKAEQASMTGFPASCLSLWQQKVAEKGHMLYLVDGS